VGLVLVRSERGLETTGVVDRRLASVETVTAGEDDEALILCREEVAGCVYSCTKGGRLILLRVGGAPHRQPGTATGPRTLGELKDAAAFDMGPAECAGEVGAVEQAVDSGSGGLEGDDGGEQQEAEEPWVLLPPLPRAEVLPCGVSVLSEVLRMCLVMESSVYSELQRMLWAARRRETKGSQAIGVP
jgi:hypothetical protein